MARVDIVVPCYGYAHFLRDCISSILNQDFRDLRVLVIDDASPDATSEVASKLAAEDSRVEVLTHRANRGLVATCNEGIDWATADYFLLLSADDLLVPGCLSRAVSILDRYPEAGLLHGAEGKLFPGRPIPVFDEAAQAAAMTRTLTGRRFIEKVCRAGTNPVGTSTAIVRTSVQKSAGYYRSELPHTSDFEMWLRIAAIADVAEADAVQGIRRHHGANMSDHYFSVIVRDYLQREAALESFFATAGRSLPGTDRLRKRAKRSLAEEAYWVGLSRICRGRLGVGSDVVKFAFRLAPTFAVMPPVAYLLRTKGSFNRIVEVASMALQGRRDLTSP